MRAFQNAAHSLSACYALTFNVEVNPSADYGWDAVGGDAEVGAQVGPGGAGERELVVHAAVASAICGSKEATFMMHYSTVHCFYEAG